MKTSIGIAINELPIALVSRFGVQQRESIAGFKLLLEGDMQSGTDAILLEGDMQAGTDVLVMEGFN